MTRFTLRIGKDARAFLETTIEAPSLDAAIEDLQEHLDAADEHNAWTAGNVVTFDETETVELVDPETDDTLWEND